MINQIRDWELYIWSYSLHNMHYLLYLILIYGLLVGFSYLITFLQLCKVTLQYPIYEIQTLC